MVEVVEPGVIVWVVVGFLVGLFGLYGCYRLQLWSNRQQNGWTNKQAKYYEDRLVDLSIRLGVLELGNVGQNHKNITIKQEVESQREIDHVEKTTKHHTNSQESNNEITQYDNITNHILQLITNEELSSRQIQTKLGRSREHVARLMKRLYDEGLVERNETTKPYTYSIKHTGLELLNPKQNP